MNDREINELVKQDAVSPEQAHEIRLRGQADQREINRLKNWSITFGLLSGMGVLWLLLLLTFGSMIANNEALSMLRLSGVLLAAAVVGWFFLVKHQRQLPAELCALTIVGLMVCFGLAGMHELWKCGIELEPLSVIIGGLCILVASLCYHAQRVPIYVCVLTTIALSFNLPYLAAEERYESLNELVIFFLDFNMQHQAYAMMTLIIWMIVAEWRMRVMPAVNPFVGVLMVLWYALILGVIYYVILGMFSQKMGYSPLFVETFLIPTLIALFMGLLYWQMAKSDGKKWSFSRMVICAMPVVLISCAQVEVNTYVAWALLTLWSLSFMWQAVFHERKSWLILSWLLQTLALWSLDLPEEGGIWIRGSLMLLNGGIMLRLATLAAQQRERQLALPLDSSDYFKKNIERVKRRSEEMNYLYEHGLIREEQREPVQRSLMSLELFPTRFFVNWMRSISITLCTLGLLFIFAGALSQTQDVKASVMIIVLLLLSCAALVAWHRLMSRQMVVTGEIMGSLALAMLAFLPVYACGTARSMEGVMDTLDMVRSQHAGAIAYMAGLLILAIFMTWKHGTRMTASAGFVLLAFLVLSMLREEWHSGMVLLVMSLLMALVGEYAIRSIRYISLSYFAVLGWLLWGFLLLASSSWQPSGMTEHLSIAISGMILLGFLYRVLVMREEGRLFRKSRILLFLAFCLPLWGGGLEWSAVSITIIAYLMMIHAMLAGRRLWCWLAPLFMLFSAFALLLSVELPLVVVLLICLVFLVTVYVVYQKRLRYLLREPK